jgi:hypothetical protein
MVVGLLPMGVLSGARGWYATARVYGGLCLVLQGDKGMASQRPRTQTDDSDRLNQPRTGDNSTTHELEWINHNRAAIECTRKTAGPQQDCNLHAAQCILAEELTGHEWVKLTADGRRDLIPKSPATSTGAELLIRKLEAGN